MSLLDTMTSVINNAIKKTMTEQEKQDEDKMAHEWEGMKEKEDAKYPDAFTSAQEEELPEVIH